MSEMSLWDANQDLNRQNAALRARVAELEAYVDLLVHGERHPHDLVFALWNETAGGAAADKASADLRTRIRELEAENARLQVQFDMVACTNIELQTENARLREALKRVRCCEDAVCDQCLREVDAALEVKP